MTLDAVLNSLGAATGMPPKEFALRLCAGYLVSWLDPYRQCAELHGLVVIHTLPVNSGEYGVYFEFHTWQGGDTGYADCGYCPLNLRR